MTQDWSTVMPIPQPDFATATVDEILLYVGQRAVECGDDFFSARGLARQVGVLEHAVGALVSLRDLYRERAEEA